jgi:hypothetical protein
MRLGWKLHISREDLNPDDDVQDSQRSITVRKPAGAKRPISCKQIFKFKCSSPDVLPRPLPSGRKSADARG